MDSVKEAVEYSCPNCSAELTFDIATQKLSCQYCGSSFTKEEIEDNFPEKEFAALSDDEQERISNEQAQFAEQNAVYNCPNCGAIVVTSNQNSASSVCHYCHTPVILSGRLAGDFKPDKIIPFKATKEQALEAFKENYRKKMFVPKDFKSDATLDYINALYVPFWITDCKVDAVINAECKTVRSVGSTKHISVYNCYRRASVDFMKVPSDGSRRIDDNLMHSIEPYNYDEMCDFAMSYLSGIDAEKYDVDKDEIVPQLQAALLDASADYVKQSLSRAFSQVSITSKNGGLSQARWQYALLPVWFMNYKYHDKDYTYVMNGQTGKFSGTLPIARLKLLLCSALSFLIFGGIVGLFAFIFGGAD